MNYASPELVQRFWVQVWFVGKDTAVMPFESLALWQQEYDACGHLGGLHIL